MAFFFITGFFFIIVHHCGIFKFAFPKERIYQVKDLILWFFAERKLGALFGVCFDFKDFCNIGVYLLSLLPLFNSPGSFPSPSQQRMLWFIVWASGAGWAGTAPAVPACYWGGGSARDALSPLLWLSHRLGDADSSSGETAGSSSIGR